MRGYQHIPADGVNIVARCKRDGITRLGIGDFFETAMDGLDACLHPRRQDAHRITHSNLASRHAAA